MLTSKVVNEGVSSVLESLRTSDLEGAKRKLEGLYAVVKTERERGSLLAASGIYSSLSKAKEGTLQSWEPARIARAAGSIVSSQMSDELDQGYAETLASYSKLIERKE